MINPEKLLFVIRGMFRVYFSAEKRLFILQAFLKILLFPFFLLGWIASLIEASLYCFILYLPIRSFEANEIKNGNTGFFLQAILFVPKLFSFIMSVFFYVFAFIPDTAIFISGLGRNYFYLYKNLLNEKDNDMLAVI
jgi:hypothetical protein